MFTTAIACLATAVYFEARSESLDAQLAVAEVVINRTHHPDFPDTVCGVVKEHRTPASRPWACQFSFFCDGKSDDPREKEAWRTSFAIAQHALDGDVLGHGAFWYHTHAVSPEWSKSEDLTAVGSIGSHRFYTDGSCLLAMGCSKRPKARPE